MTAPLLTRLRETPRFLRPTAAIVLIAFLMLILEPLAVAAQNNPPPASAKPTDDGDRRFSATVENIEQHLQWLHDKHSRRQDSSRERSELKRLHQTLRQLDTDERQSFDKIERHLREHHLPAEILERHREMVEHYDAEQRALTQELDAIEAAGGDAERNDHMQTALKRLKAKSNKPAHQPFDPKNLPFQVPDGKIRAPKETPEELKKLIQAQAPVQVAALALSAGMLAQATTQTTNAPQAADLAPTEDVQITDDIKALVQSLNNNPVEIYNWVRSNIEYIPTYGSIQGSQLTLANQKGNAFDTASLLIALYRAAGIPARYVYGTVQIPIEQVMNWVGGVADPMAALQLLGQGGIPNTGLAQGGVIKFVKMEHVWVEAWIDFIPSRGAKHKTGDTWVALDASFKQYDYSKTLDLEGKVSFDSAAVITEALSTAIVNQEDDTLTQVDETHVIASLKDFQTRMAAFLAQEHPDVDIKQLTGEGTILKQTPPVLAAGLPYQLISHVAGFSSLAASMRHQITVNFFQTVTDRALDSPVISKTLSLPALSTSRLGITYIPATQADTDVWQYYRDNWGDFLPLYLIYVKPVIKLDDTIVLEGPPVRMGDDQYIDLVLASPSGKRTLAYNRLAGEEMVVGIDGATVSPETVKKRFDKVPADTAAENLNQLALHYWAENDLLTPLLAKIYHVKAVRLPSVGLFTSKLNVQYNFSIPYKGYYLARNVDIKHSMIAVAGGDAAARLNFVKHSGATMSYLESSIFEQVFHAWQGFAVSAMQILIDANKQGIPIYTINSNNAAALLSKVSAAPEVLDDIKNALNAGLEVTVPAQPPAHIAWSGTGYILMDPVTGAGSYRISGGADGADGTAPCAKPEPVPIAVKIKEIVLTAIVIAALTAAIIYAGGAIAAGAGVTGTGLGAGGAKILAELMAAFGLTFLSFEATAGEFCKPIPVTPHRGGDDFHNDYCADLAPPNQFPGSDICVSDGTNQKLFDAINGKTLWEAKTDNLDNWEPSKRDFFAKLAVLGQWKETAIEESPIARACGYGYKFVVGDNELATSARADSSLSILVDQFDVNPVLCLAPWSGKYPKR